MEGKHFDSCILAAVFILTSQFMKGLIGRGILLWNALPLIILKVCSIVFAVLLMRNQMLLWFLRLFDDVHFFLSGRLEALWKKFVSLYCYKKSSSIISLISPSLLFSHFSTFRIIVEDIWPPEIIYVCLFALRDLFNFIFQV